MERLLGLPLVTSQHGGEVDTVIVLLHWLMVVLFVGWLTYFAIVLVRFRKSRNPRANYFGVRNHVLNYIEVPWSLPNALFWSGSRCRSGRVPPTNSRKRANPRSSKSLPNSSPGMSFIQDRTASSAGRT